MQWYTGTEVGGVWGDAPDQFGGVELTEMLLDVARQQVLAYAEEGEPGEQVSELLSSLGYPAATVTAVLDLLGEEVPDPPTRYVYAQLQQAKNLFNTGRIGNVDGTDGVDGFIYTPRPLDKTIRSIIRPKSGGRNVL